MNFFSKPQNDPYSTLENSLSVLHSALTTMNQNKPSQPLDYLSDQIGDLIHAVREKDHTHKVALR